MSSSIATTSPELLALCALLGLTLGALLMYWGQLLRGRSLGRARNLRGQRGEDRAAALLTAAGYTIVARQQRAAYALRSNDAELQVKLSFDFVVEKDGKTCVAEVKTGALGPQLKHADTRRQLLEYQLVSGAREVLLVDPEREQISHVSFPHAQPHVAKEPARLEATSPWPLLVCAAFCALCAYLWMR